MTEPGVPPDVVPSTLPDNNWGRYSIGQLWAMLEHESRASGEVAAQMWERIRRVCDLEADLLERALAKLADHWPKTQDAAVAFQDWGRTLVRAMRDTAAVAARSGWAVDMITQEIAIAKGRVGELMGEYIGYMAVEQQNPSGISMLATNLVHAGRRLFGGEGLSPDTVLWRTTLPAEAREVMADLERKVASYSTIVRWDPPYQPHLTSERELPTVPEPSIEGTGAGGWLPSSAWRMPLPDVPPPSAPPIETPGDWPPSDQSDLPESEDPTLEGDTVLGGGPGGPGPGGGLPIAGGGPFIDTPAGRVLAPGGVIGGPGAGGSGAAPGGLGGAAGPGAAGVGTGAGATGRPAGAAGMMPVMPPMMAGRPGNRGATGAAGRRVRRGLPSAFDTPEGPPAVIRPPEEPTEHDPGPGVIGIDQ